MVSLTFVAPPTLLLLGLVAWVDVPQWQASRTWRQAEDAARQGSLRSAFEGLRDAAPRTHDVVAYARQAEVARSAGDAHRCAEAAPESPYALWGLAQLSAGPSRIQLLRQAAEAAHLEWARLPPALARQEREQLQRLAQNVEEELAQSTE